MARLYFDCGASDDSLNSSTPRIIMFDSLRNSVITYHKTKHNGHRVLTRVHVQSGVKTVLYDSDTHGKNILNIYLDHCGNLYLHKDYHNYKLLADNKLEIVNICGSQNYMFFDSAVPVNCLYKRSKSDKTPRNYIEFKITKDLPHLYTVFPEGLHECTIPIAQFSDRRLLWLRNKPSRKYLITTGFQDNCRLLAEYSDLHLSSNIFIDELDNIIHVGNAKIEITDIIHVSKTEIEIYNDKFQLLERISHMIDTDSFYAPYITYHDKQLFYSQDGYSQLYVMDLPYRYWTPVTHKFYARYHPQIMTIMMLKQMDNICSLIPMEVWSIIFSEF